MKGFVEFIREQGVVGLAIGFILGGAVSKVVASLVGDIINPFLSITLGGAGNLKDATFHVKTITVPWGNFAANLIDFLVIATVVYIGFKILRFEKLDKKRE